MNKCYLGLGSNLKTPPRQIRLSLSKLKGLPKSALIKTAPLLITTPWGVRLQPLYCNTVVQLNTTLSPHALLKKIHVIEKQQGRVRRRKWGARTLDIDILYYGERVLNHPKLVIPHPYINQREFVLAPLRMLM